MARNAARTWIVGALALGVVAAFGADILTVDDGGTVRFGIATSGAVTVNANDAGAPAVTILNPGGGGVLRLDDGSAAAGRVWTALDGTGRGTWQVPAGGGGGAPSVILLANDALAHLRQARLAPDGAVSVERLAAGVVDELEDEAGINLGASTNQVYEPTEDYYHNPGGLVPRVPTSIADWDQRNPGDTYGVGIVNSGASRSSYTKATELVGDFSYEFKTTTWNTDWTVTGVFDNAEAATAACCGHHERAGMNAMVKSFWIEGPSPRGYRQGNTLEATATGLNTTDTYEFRRLAGTISFRNKTTDTTLHTFAGSHTEDMRVTVGGGQPNTVSGIVFNSSTGSQDMTLVANGVTAAAQPSDVFITVWEEDVDAVTLNVDLIAEASRDGGTTWTAVPLSQQVTLSPGRLLIGTVSVAAQPAGTSMVWRLRCLNSKGLRIHGVALNWS